MFVKAFCKIIDENTRIRVFDKYGHAGTFEAKKLLIFIDGYRYITDIKASAFNMVDITIN